MKSKVEKDLTQLIIHNPELEIIPFCAEECGNPDFGWSIGKITECSVDECATSDVCEERLFIKSKDFDDFEESYRDKYDNDEDITDDLIEREYESLSWVKSILIWIDAM